MYEQNQDDELIYEHSAQLKLIKNKNIYQYFYATLKSENFKNYESIRKYFV
jgi:hypothetical protein